MVICSNHAESNLLSVGRYFEKRDIHVEIGEQFGMPCGVDIQYCSPTMSDTARNVNEIALAADVEMRGSSGRLGQYVIDDFPSWPRY